MFKKFINSELDQFLKRLKQHKNAYIFMEPIQNIISMYPDYTLIITHPIDLIIIQDKINNKIYNQPLEFEQDITTMLENCKTFNRDCANFYNFALNLQTFFNNNFSKTVAKINKAIEKEQKIIDQKLLESNQRNHQSNKGKYIPLISNNSEEEKIFQRIFSLLMKNSNDLNAEGEKLEDIAQHLTKSIIRKTSTFDIIYDDMVKFLNNNMINKEDKENKGKILKKFRKILKAIKDEMSVEVNKLNIKLKINKDSKLLGESDYKSLMENTIFELQEILDNQKVPEIFREVGEYPIAAEDKKQINDLLDSIETDVRKDCFYLSNGTNIIIYYYLKLI